MCIINEPAVVANTEILVSPNYDNTRQLVVYKNEVTTIAHNNAMILPVPHIGTIKLHDLSQYENLFTDCSKSFFSNMLMRENNTEWDVLDDALQVYRYGSYNLSIVSTHDDFHRLDRNYFQLNENVGQILRKYYDANIGFLVCKLRRGQGKYHPIAYSHQIYQPNIMFVPTRHHHLMHEEHHSHYDHHIYSINTKSLCGSENWNYQFKLQTQLISDFDFPEVVCFNQLAIKKKDLNTDMYFYLDSYVEPIGQCHGVDGCLFKTNHPEVTFKNKGSVYTQVFYRGLPFLKEKSNEFNFDRKGLAFAGTGTTFTVTGNQIKVIDDIGTPLEHELSFTFDPYEENINPGVYLTTVPHQGTRPTRQVSELFNPAFMHTYHRTRSRNRW
jgi:hypothetical protein